MKKIFLFCLLLLSFTVLLSSCQVEIGDNAYNIDFPEITVNYVIFIASIIVIRKLQKKEKSSVTFIGLFIPKIILCYVILDAMSDSN